VLWSHKVVSVRTDRSRAVNEGSIPGVTRSFDDWATSYDSVIVQAPIFSNSPARALDSTATAYTATPFFNDDPTIMQAPIFSNSPARALDSTAAAYTATPFFNDDPTIMQAPIFSNSPARAPIFLNSPARALDSTATAYTATPFFNDDPTIMQAPIFSNSPARALDSTAAASTDASFSRLSVSYPQTNSQGNIQSMGTFSSLGIP
jgi:hypothetical protein